jgi:hypothetical protein
LSSSFKTLWDFSSTEEISSSLVVGKVVDASGSTVLSSSGEISVEASTDKTSAILLQGQESTLDGYQQSY